VLHVTDATLIYLKKRRDLLLQQVSAFQQELDVSCQLTGKRWGTAFGHWNAPSFVTTVGPCQNRKTV
jgi:hypothetical protein